MFRDKSKIKEALDNIGSNYKKILLVNLSQDTFDICNLAEDEAQIVADKHITKMSEYWDWFCHSDLLHADDREMCLEYQYYPGTSLIYRRWIDGEWHMVYMEVTATSSYTDSNKTCVLYVKDINNVYAKAYDSVVEKIGTTDQKTGLLNQLALERDKDRHRGKPVGVIFADVNGLKKTNDEQGHAAGDKLILNFAGLLSTNFGDYRIYHISGDEFVVCCYGVSLHDFLVKSIAFHKTMWLSMERPLASIGYSISESGDWQKAYDEAEKEMYDDKRLFYTRFPQYKR